MDAFFRINKQTYIQNSIQWTNDRYAESLLTKKDSESSSFKNSIFDDRGYVSSFQFEASFLRSQDKSVYDNILQITADINNLDIYDMGNDQLNLIQSSIDAAQTELQNLSDYGDNDVLQTVSSQLTNLSSAVSDLTTPGAPGSIDEAALDQVLSDLQTNFTSIQSDIEDLLGTQVVSNPSGIEDLDTMLIGDETALLAGKSADSNITGFQDGSSVVTWGTGGDIYARLYDTNGDAIGSEFKVNTSTQNVQDNASITAFDDGSFVITWEGKADGGPKGDGTEIFAQRYDSTGAAVGSEIQVNTALTGDQKNASVTALSDGGFVVSYETKTGDDLIFQRFDSSGNA